MTPTNTPSPGERQHGETDTAFRAFRTYLDLGPDRSLAKCGRALGKNKTSLERWSAKNRWVERVRQIESTAAAMVDDERAKALAEVAGRQAQEMRLQATSLAMITSSFLKRIQQNPALLDGLDAETHAKLATAAARAHSRVIVAERLVHGMTTEQAGERTPWEAVAEQAARLTDAELDARLAGVDEVAAAREARKARKAS